ncbi:NlpC/P60 family protein [Paenibacillus psychroresistens]|uniref:NlpC/P60 family protein n=1 Tax=Paenibacillus psychroresistens TaxID=1778678 RepID=A0A6B8RVX8_9BACL|nr:C40 family peptidase [Paenibacillus psychroresistens]QGR00053.1 NlpC/P60 family protein [Paenibacillus psychroresistens]
MIRFAKSLAGISLSLSLLFSGCLFLTSKPAHASSFYSVSSSADKIISTGKQLLGTPYLYAAQAAKTSTFDCSSFTQYVFNQNGIILPRSSTQQSQVGTYVSRNQLKPGDLIFFYAPIHHVAIYMGNGKILHATKSAGVAINDLNSGYWNSHYTKARRVLH